MASMWPVPSVISVSCCDFDMEELTPAGQSPATTPAAPLAFCGSGGCFWACQQILQAGEEIDRDGKDDGRVFLDADFGQRLQIAQLDAGGSDDSK